MASNGFRLNGKPFSTTPTPRLVLKIREFVSVLPNNELLTTRELFKKLGYSYEGGWSHSRAHPAIKEFVVEVRYPSRQCVWGNKKTIAQLRKHKEIIA